MKTWIVVLVMVLVAAVIWFGGNRLASARDNLAQKAAEVKAAQDGPAASGMYCQTHRLRTKADVVKALGKPPVVIWKYGKVEVYLNPATGLTPYGEMTQQK